MPWIEQNAGGTASPSLVLSDTSATTTTVTLTVPDGLTLVSWTLQYKAHSSSTWLDYATGITELEQDVTGLTAETQYDFRPVVTGVVTGGVVSVTTDPPPPPPAVPLVYWSQIGEAQDFGSPVNGGSIKGWNNAGDLTSQTNPRNDEPENIIAVQIIVESRDSRTPGSRKGFAVRSNNVWDVSRVAVQLPSGGSMGDAKIALTEELALTHPWVTGARAVLQDLNGAGYISPAKSLGNGYFPSTGLMTDSISTMGDVLGVVQTGGLYGPWGSRVYCKRATSPLYVIALFGDSTVANVRPIAAVNNNAKEGWSHMAMRYLRTAGKRIRPYSYGQGTATWSQTLARVRANLPHLAGRVSRIGVQVWTWNSPWTTIPQAETAWSEYLLLQMDCESAGIQCFPFILNPYTTRTGAGQPEAFDQLKSQTLEHPFGVAFDTIMGGADWPNIPTAWSEDNVHLNGPGAVATAADVAGKFIELAVKDGHPEIA